MPATDARACSQCGSAHSKAKPVLSPRGERGGEGRRHGAHLAASSLTTCSGSWASPGGRPAHSPLAMGGEGVREGDSRPPNIPNSP
eukprot:6597619-Prymnesium_polylepis.1